VGTSGSGEELTWRHHRTGETLLKVEFRREEEDRAEMEQLVEEVSTAFTAFVERSQVCPSARLRYRLRR
jgi:hypothetical protein